MAAGEAGKQRAVDVGKKRCGGRAASCPTSVGHVSSFRGSLWGRTSFNCYMLVLHNPEPWHTHATAGTWRAKEARKPTVLDHVAGAVRAPAAADICRRGFRSHPRMKMMMMEVLAGPRAAEEMFASCVREQRAMMERLLQVTSPHLLGGATISPPCVCLRGSWEHG